MKVCYIYIPAFFLNKHHIRWYYSKIYVNLRSISWYLHMQYLRFSQQCCWRLKFPEMWSCVIMPIFPSCLNDHSDFVFRAKQRKEIVFGLLDPEGEDTTIIQHIRKYSPNNIVLRPTNPESLFIPVLGKTFCITKQTDSWVINVSISSSRKISVKSEYFPTVVCMVVTLCSPGGAYHHFRGYILLLSTGWTLKMWAEISHRIFDPPSRLHSDTTEKTTAWRHSLVIKPAQKDILKDNLYVIKLILNSTSLIQFPLKQLSKTVGNLQSVLHQTVDIYGHSNWWYTRLKPLFPTLSGSCWLFVTTVKVNGLVEAENKQSPINTQTQ